MSLNKIRLTNEILGRLYEKTLNVSEAYSETTVPVTNKSYRAILIIVSDPQSENLSSADHAFVSSVLTACQQSIEDAVVCNVAVSTANVKEYLSTDRNLNCLLFGVDPAIVGGEVLDKYKVQRAKNISFIHAPGLKEIQDNVAEKKKLWVSLKQLFNLQ